MARKKSTTQKTERAATSTQSSGGSKKKRFEAPALPPHETHQEGQRPSVPTDPKTAGSAPPIPSDLRMMAVTLQLGEVIKGIQPMAQPELSSFREDLAALRSHLAEVVLGTKKPPKAQQNIALSYFSSVRMLPGYSTLDSAHVADIQDLVFNITKYAADPTKTRPLVALMIAAPGAGKSHFINCLAARLRGKDVVPITYNMSAMERNDDLSQVLDSARNLKVEDKLPLIFLDEFDTHARNYALLLPLLWDGEIHVGQRDLKLGKVIIVLAGSKPKLPQLMDQAASMQLDVDVSSDSSSEETKLVDLLSRINAGTIRIPGLDLVDASRDRRLDKICISLALLSARFGDHLTEVPRSLLRFIALTEFRYGVRSIAHLIDLIPYIKKPQALTHFRLHLPLSRLQDLRKSSLAYHIVDEEQGHTVVGLWKACAKNDVPLRYGTKALIDVLSPSGKKRTTRASRTKK